MRIQTGKRIEGIVVIDADVIEVNTDNETVVDLYVNGKRHEMTTAQADALALMLQAASCVVGARSR